MSTCHDDLLQRLDQFHRINQSRTHGTRRRSRDRGAGGGASVSPRHVPDCIAHGKRAHSRSSRSIDSTGAGLPSIADLSKFLPLLGLGVSEADAELLTRDAEDPDNPGRVSVPRLLLLLERLELERAVTDEGALADTLAQASRRKDGTVSVKTLYMVRLRRL